MFSEAHMMHCHVLSKIYNISVISKEEYSAQKNVKKTLDFDRNTGYSESEISKY